MKITLTDIMESLNSDNVEDAQAALHEWFVEQSKAVHRNIVDPVPVMENEEDDIYDLLDKVCALVATGESEGESEFNLGSDLATMIWRAVPYQPSGDQNFPEVMSELVASVGSNEVFDSGIWPDDERGVSVAYVVFTYAEVDEAQINELSRDTQMSYAKKARKYRDSESADDEKVGRRVVGLDMVANKARKEKNALQYEAEVSESEDDDFDLYSLAGYPDLEVDQDGNPESGPQVSFSGIVNGYFIDLLFSENWSDNSVEGVLAKIAASDEVYDDEDGSTENVLPASEMPDEIKMPLAQAISVHIEKSIAAEYGDEEDDEFDDEEFDDEEDDVEESTNQFTVESLIAELQEGFAGLETVSDKLQNVEGAQVGEQGKVSVNTKATLPSHKGDKRVGGEAVEIKGKGHTGHALEKSPKVADVKVKGNVQNSKDNPTKVTANKSALLNKMDGSTNTQSPISGKGAKGLKK